MTATAPISTTSGLASASPEPAPTSPETAPASPEPAPANPVRPPLLTVVVPAYNADAYLARALDSLIGFGSEVEILIIDDGSTDHTAALACGYANRHPASVRVIHKPNGGHGSAINTGLDYARGTYFKVLDADDWINRDAMMRVLATLGRFTQPSSHNSLRNPRGAIDLLVSNFVYEKEGKRTKTVVRYHGALPRGRVIGWSQTRRFAKRQYLMMHALTYRTQVLRDAGLRLPEHTFYVDNLYAFVPLAQVRTLFYLDVDLYRYHIGRPDQSVHESVMLQRLDQQLRVNRLMLEHISRTYIANEHLRRYLLHYTKIICAVSSILLVRTGTPAALDARDQLWAELRSQDPWLYRKVRWSGLGQITNLPSSAGRRVSVLAYKVAQRAIGFS